MRFFSNFKKGKQKINPGKTKHIISPSGRKETPSRTTTSGNRKNKTLKRANSISRRIRKQILPIKKQSIVNINKTKQKFLPHTKH